MKTCSIVCLSLAATVGAKNLNDGVARQSGATKQDAKVRSNQERRLADYEGEWTPRAGESWNYNLAAPVDTAADVDVVVMNVDAGQDTIDVLHDQGKHVVCYISIGSYEDWREDAGDFPDDAVGNTMDGWAGEKWLDITNEGLKAVMEKRVEKAASMFCDGIEPDHMMNYMEKGTGFSFGEAEQVAYNMWFADVVHANCMKVGLKNAIELVPMLVDTFDFAVNEECNDWNECGTYGETFIAQGKPVFNVEYSANKDMCSYTNELGMDTIIKNYGLKSEFCSCADSSRDINCNDVL